MRASQARVTTEVERLNAARMGGEPVSKVICRPGVGYDDVVADVGEGDPGLTRGERSRVETLMRYAAYIERARKQLASRAEYETTSLGNVDYRKVASLSNEGREALERARPDSVGAAQRVRGVRDSDISALLVHLAAKQPRASSSGHDGVRA